MRDVYGIVKFSILRAKRTKFVNCQKVSIAFGAVVEMQIAVTASKGFRYEWTNEAMRSTHLAVEILPRSDLA